MKSQSQETISGVLALVIANILLASIYPPFIDQVYKTNMKEIHSKCSKHCLHKRRILRGEYDI